MKKILHLIIAVFAVVCMICVAGCVDDNSSSSEEPLSTVYSPIGYWVGNPMEGVTYTIDVKSLSNVLYSMTVPRGQMTAEAMGLDVLGYSGDIKSIGANAYLEEQDTNTYSVIQTSARIVFYDGQELSYDRQSLDESNTLGYFELYSDALMRFYLKRGGNFVLNKKDTVATTSQTPVETIKLLGEWKGNSGGVTLSINFVSNTEGYMKYIYPDKTVLAADVMSNDAGLTGYLRTIGTSIELTKIGNNMYSISQKDMYVDTYSGTTLNIPKSADFNADGGYINVISSTKMKYIDEASGASLELTK